MSQNENIPQHISIIMDGNRRWAKERGLPSLEGHRKGAENLEKLLDYCKKRGIKCVSTWAFSTENWKRSEDEKKYLFDLMREAVKKHSATCLEKESRFIHLGRKDRIPEDLKNSIMEIEEKTKGFTDFTFAIAIDYGGHDELMRTIKKLEEEKLEITTENIESHLDTNKLPQVDLIIRTGGDYRLSGFMSWQCAYAELFFTKYFTNRS